MEQKNLEMSREKQKFECEMAEMLEIIEKAREIYANDITDHTENEYIREGLLDAGYRKQEWISVDERLQEDIARLTDDNEYLQDKVFKVRLEVAREIFEEIDSKILAEIDLCNGVLIEFEEADEPYHRIKGEVSALCKTQDFIAELKKKYAEEKK